jgi:hypothetical protein
MGQHFRPVVINCSDRFFCLLAGTRRLLASPLAAARRPQSNYPAGLASTGSPLSPGRAEVASPLSWAEPVEPRTYDTQVEEEAGQPANGTGRAKALGGGKQCLNLVLVLSRSLHHHRTRREGDGRNI